MTGLQAVSGFPGQLRAKSRFRRRRSRLELLPFRIIGEDVFSVNEKAKTSGQETMNVSSIDQRRKEFLSSLPKARAQRSEAR